MTDVVEVGSNRAHGEVITQIHASDRRQIFSDLEDTRGGIK